MLLEKLSKKCELSNYTDEQIGKAIRVSYSEIESNLDGCKLDKFGARSLNLAKQVLDMSILNGTGEL